MSEDIHAAERARRPFVALWATIIKRVFVSNYRIVIRGVQKEQSAEQVAVALSRYSKKSPEKLRELLSSGHDLVAKRTPEVKRAMQYKQMLEKMGCVCLIQAEITGSTKGQASAPAPTDHGQATSLTNFTDGYPVGAMPPREYQYAKPPFWSRLQDIVRVLRLKEVIGLAIFAVAFLYWWKNFS